MPATRSRANSVANTQPQPQILKNNSDEEESNIRPSKRITKRKSINNKSTNKATQPQQRASRSHSDSAEADRSASEFDWPIFSIISPSYFLLLSITILKLFFLPLYRSTDFEVHRNWLAITHSLPLDRWYLESTSPWTLDYPPFFAWFEYLLSWPARLFDPNMLIVENLNYSSWATIVFQRFSVIACDLLLFQSIKFYAKVATKVDEQEENQSSNSSLSSTTSSSFSSADSNLYEFPLLFLSFCNFGLLIVDHIHFQYNGLLLAILIYSLSFIKANNRIPSIISINTDLIAGFIFAVLINFKHIFLYIAPAYFVYLLAHYCFGKSASFKRASLLEWFHRLRRLLLLGSLVIAVFAVSLFPFIYFGQLTALRSRLFPFQRGLTHSYWASNIWAIYNFLDVALSFIGDIKSSSTLGLVSELSFNCLPNVSPSATFILTLTAMMPGLIQLYRFPHPRVFLLVQNYVFLCSFLFGWHVHEKSLLILLVPLSLTALESASLSKIFLFFSFVGNFSLFPLIFTQTEQPIILLLYLIYSAISYQILSQWHFHHTVRKRRIKFNGFFNSYEIIYLIGIPILYCCQHFIIPMIPALAKFQFLPLMLISLYCAIGCVYGFYLIAMQINRTIEALDEID